MRTTSHMFSILFVLCLACTNGSKSTPTLKIFSEQNTRARTDVVFLQKEDNTYILMCVGGSSPQSADCVIKSTGRATNSKITGYLVDVNTDIASYKIDIKKKIPFSAVLVDSMLEITGADVTDLCGLNSNFVKKYYPIKDKKILSKTIGDFIELLQASKGNEDLLPALKDYLSQQK